MAKNAPLDAIIRCNPGWTEELTWPTMNRNGHKPKD